MGRTQSDCEHPKQDQILWLAVRIFIETTAIFMKIVRDIYLLHIFTANIPAMRSHILVKRHPPIICLRVGIIVVLWPVNFANCAHEPCLDWLPPDSGRLP